MKSEYDFTHAKRGAVLGSATPSEAKRIRNLAEADLHLLEEPLRTWAKSHLAFPRPIKAWIDPCRSLEIEVWLVTDHIGDRDSSSRVVFDSSNACFGLVQTLDDGTHWYMGPYEGGFANVVRSM